ncbi:MAG: sulfite exporter TauE/SafE family protein [Alphaproteobacteria bacterium]
MNVSTLDAAVGPWAAAYAIGVAAAAGLLRGFTGFGFALLAVPALTLVFPPAEVVPCVLLMQLFAGVQLVRATIRWVDWTSAGPMLAAAVLVTPLGTKLLTLVSADATRAGIGLLLLVTVPVLWRSPARLPRPSLPVRLAVGVASGLLNGATAMSGPPVIAYFLATAEARVARASMLAYFLLLSLAGVASSTASGLVARSTLLHALVLVPPLVAGTWLGHRWFELASDETHRRIALVVLAIVAIAALARVVAG